MADQTLEYQIYPEAREYRGQARRYWLETWTMDVGKIDYGGVRDYIVGWTENSGQRMLDFLAENIGGIDIPIIGGPFPKLRFRWTAHLSGAAIDDARAFELLSEISDRIFWTGYANTSFESQVVQWTGRSFPRDPPGGTGGATLNTLALVAAAGVLLYVMSTDGTSSKGREVGREERLI